jgi:hypothetical protein
MNASPRAIVGQVRCMARPRRPYAEAQAVREAALIARAETGLTSAKALSREIARRVVVELMADLEADPLDLAFAAIERDLLQSPFQRLASCPDINLAAEFVKRRTKSVEDRQGRYLSPPEQAAERRAIESDLRDALAKRYDRQLRTSGR